ncbi:PIN domain-containing protein [Kitasatospora sp. NPDC086791]|uniref:PIN domain-containing protein n=1 Tax=Kitasatospora sp. NPDC086791 TaxID=3155178 RepID=UPI003443A421
MLITPRPGTHRDNILQALRNTRDDVQNLYTSGPRETLPRLLKYLEWANDAVGRLAGQIADRDLDKLILTSRHAQILANVAILASPDAVRFANGLVNLELRQRTDDLNEAAQALEAAARRRQQAGRNIVFDTGMFLNHPDKFDQIDYRALTNIFDEPVNLVVPMVVIDELDNLKQHNKQQVRWRAGYSLAVLDRLFSSGRPSVAVLRDLDLSEAAAGGLPRSKVTVELLFDQPGHIRLPIADDEIVDQALTLQALAGEEVTLFTYDTGQSMRARNAGLTAKKLRLEPEEPQAKG